MKKFKFKLHSPTTGELLIQKLGLQKFKYIWITKILNLPINVYIIFVNARYYKQYLPYQKLFNLQTFVISKLLHVGSDIKLFKPKILPPRLLNKDFNEYINSNSVIIKVDITGEQFIPQMVYEHKSVRKQLQKFIEENKK